MALQPEFPAASKARTVIVLSPTSNGTFADQAVVPLAVPEPPVEVVQVTFTTPMLSLAFPDIAIDVPVVATIVAAGDTIVTLGEVVSIPAGGDGAGVGGGVGAGAGAGVGEGVGDGAPRTPYKACTAAMSSLVKPVCCR